MTAADFAELVGHAKRHGKEWSAHCPAHEDDRASLSFRDGVKGLVLTCHRGCSHDAICLALKIPVASLFFHQNGGGPLPADRRIVAVYDYQDLAGAALFQVVRTADKDFWQRRPTLGGAWVNGLGDVARVLYHLPEIQGQPEVFIVEGEKDVDRLRAAGLVATCNPMGAGKWTDVHTQQIVAARVARVVVIGDNDRAGQAHATAVVTALAASGPDVRLLQLPGLPPVREKHGEDVSDWLDQGHTVAELQEVVMRTPVVAGPTPAPAAEDPAPLGVGLGTFLAQTFADAPPLIQGLLSADGNGWIAGEEKLGKTFFALEEALALSLGQPVAGRFPVPERRRVMFIEEEDPPRRAHVRTRALLRGRGLDPEDAALRAELDGWFRIEVWSGFTLDDPAWIARLDATCATFKPAVCYLDVLRKLTTKDLNKADQAGALLATLDDLRRRHGVIFRVLHHYRKSQGFRVSRGSQEIGGSFVLGAWGECSLFFEPIGRKQGGGCRVDVQVKDGPPVPSFRLQFYAEGPAHAPTLVRLTAEDEAEDTSADDVLLQAIGTAPKTDALVGRPGVLIATLITMMKKSDKTIRRALKRLVSAKLIEVSGQAGKGADLYGIPE